MTNKERQIKLLQEKLDIAIKMVASVSAELNKLIEEDQPKAKPIYVEKVTPVEDDDIEISNFPF